MPNQMSALAPCNRRSHPAQAKNAGPPGPRRARSGRLAPSPAQPVQTKGAASKQRPCARSGPSRTHHAMPTRCARQVQHVEIIGRQACRADPSLHRALKKLSSRLGGVLGSVAPHNAPERRPCCQRRQRRERHAARGLPQRGSGVSMSQSLRRRSEPRWLHRPGLYGWKILSETSWA